MNGFSYNPLASSREIRVLDLKFSDDRSAPIDLEMRHMTIEHPPERTPAAIIADWQRKVGTPLAYYALSYTWGEGATDRLININGTEVSIGANLEGALRNLRARRVTPLWVDAICINQSDDVEKSIQVRSMSNIYESALAVIIWLGEARATTALAINFLKEHITLNFTRVSHHNDLATTRFNPEYAVAWDAVGQDLLKRPWWMRMWVVQEVALARRTVIFCGPYDLPWDHLEIANDIGFAYDLPIFYKTPEEIARGDIFSQSRNLMTKARYRRARAQGTGLRLQELLINNVSCFAKDPRDMIFSVLGLATDVTDAAELTVDYQKPVEQVYTDLVKFQVRKYESLDIICASKCPKKQAHLPSWVPDWSNLRENTSVILPSFEHDPYKHGRYVYRASGDTKPNARFLEQDKTLSVSGIFFDTILKMGESTDDFESLTRLILEPWQQLALELILESGHDEYVVRGESVLDAFNRTITADLTRSGHRAQDGQKGLEVLKETGHVIPESYRQHQGLSDEERLRFWQNDSLIAVALRASRRRFIVTKKGYLGLAPPNSKLGDAVVIILGLSVPAILRRKDQAWHFVGESFITGIMDGEVLAHGPSQQVERNTEASASAFEVEEILLR